MNILHVVKQRENMFSVEHSIFSFLISFNSVSYSMYSTDNHFSFPPIARADDCSPLPNSY